MRSIPWASLSEWAVLLLIPFSILWKGGKSLETTWILVGVAWFCTLSWWAALRAPSTVLRAGSPLRHGEPVEPRSGVPPFLWLSVLLFLLWSALSYRYSLTQNYGLDEVLRDGSLGLVFLWVARKQLLTTHYSLLTRILQVLAYSTLLACLIGIAVYVLQPVNRFVGTFFDWRFHTDYWPNSWAEYLLLAWPVVWWWGRGVREYGSTGVQEYGDARILEYWNIGILGFVFGCLLLSYSRAAWMVFVGQVVLWGILNYVRSRRLSSLCVILPFGPEGLISMPSSRCRGRPSNGRSPVPSQTGLLVPMQWKNTLIRCSIILLIALGTFFGANGLRAKMFEVQSVLEKVTFTSAEGASSASERVQFWKASWDLAWQRPYLGWGPYSFRFVQPHMQEGVLATSDHPHNVFLKLAMERGWVAAILFMLIVGWVLYRTFFFLCHPEKPSILYLDSTTLTMTQDAGRPCPEPVERVEGPISKQFSIFNYQLSIALVVSVVGVLLHNLVDYNLQFVGIALPFWLILGILAGNAAKITNHPTTHYSPFGLELMAERLLTTHLTRIVEISLASLLLIVAIFEGRFLIISSFGRYAETRGMGELALHYYEASQGEWFSRDLLLSRTHLLINNNRFIEAKDSIQEYLNVNAQDFRAWRLNGDLHFRAGELSEAIAAYEKAFLFGKWNDLGILRGIIETRVAQQEWLRLADRLPSFSSILETYAAAIERNVHFIALSSNIEEFLKVTNRLAKVSPKEEATYVGLGAQVDRKAKEERAKISARLPGFLW